MKPENSAFRTGTLRRAPTNSEIGNPKSEIRNRLIIFTRYPRPGETKTRLIPALGAEGAAELHRRMIEHTLSWARRLKSQTGTSLEVCYAGAEESLFQDWLGLDLLFRPQGPGDLGVRMARAFKQAFDSGLERVVLVGTDIPDLNGRLIQRAFEALCKDDLVLGPAKDGGYYLVGLRRPMGEIFRDIPWGTGKVLVETLRTARHLGARFSFIKALEDVDRPEDLQVWEKFLTPFPPSSPGKGKGGGDSLLISIIIPTLNEQENIAACLASTQNAPNVERIVVDGGSKDRTVEIARSCGARVIKAPAGRARQMNHGARSAAGDLLLFLHADTHLPLEFANTVRQVLSLPGIAAGAFEFRLDAASPGLRFIERVANWRSRRLQLPYGDQGIFIRSASFKETGGFPDIPIMEDFEFIQRLKKRGRIYTAPYPAITSARRWKRLGTWQATLLNEVIVSAYYLGFSPNRIHRWTRRNG